MNAIQKIKLRKELAKQLTPEFAHHLLAQMPNEDFNEISYDPQYKKFFKCGSNFEQLIWSHYLKRWILWLNEFDDSFHWKGKDIFHKSKEYQYKIGDRVLYCGLSNDDESEVLTVSGFYNDQVIVSNGSDYNSPFYMYFWRLATKEESDLGERIFISPIDN